MMKIEMLTDDDLLCATRAIVHCSLAVTADLLAHLGEIDARQLYLGRAFPSMFAFCVSELGFSEDVAYNRIAVARLGRRLPSVLDSVRAGQVHLTGLRILAPHLTEENVGALLNEASGKSKKAIEEIGARLAPKPAVASLVRKLPVRALPAPAAPALLVATLAPNPPPPIAPIPPPPSLPRAVVKPLAEEIFKVQFTARRPLRDKLKELQDLLRHAVPDGDLAEIVERGVDLLLAEVKKQRFAVGRKPRPTSSAEPVTTEEPATTTRHIPDSIKRTVYERDGGQCTFLAPDGRRCAERACLEFDHAEGFARTHSHKAEDIRLRCRAHNQFAANEMYGRAFMDEARQRARAREPVKRGRPGAGSEEANQPLLL